jgi:16S rRNA pseudouridine516 synthase
MSKSPTVRIERLLANLGYGSRKDIQALADAGALVLDGEALTGVAGRIALDPDLPQRLSVSGAALDPLPGMVLMLHKPVGVTCSRKEAGALVYDLLPRRWRLRSPALSTVGRLDKETSGLLLMTDDGALLHRIISPRSALSKRYRASLDRPLKGNEAEILASGTLMLEGEDKPLLPSKLEVMSETEIYLTITEGRYHQVRRTFAALGNHVITLHRDRIGGLDLPDDLEPGAYRLLDAGAVADIFSG